MSRLNIEKIDSTADSTKYLPADEISDLVESYINRKKIEEVEKLQRLGGSNNLNEFAIYLGFQVKVTSLEGSIQTLHEG